MTDMDDYPDVYPGIFKRGNKNYGFRAQVAGGGGKQVRRSGFEKPLAAHNARRAYLGGEVTVSADTMATWFEEFLSARQLRPTSVENYRYSFKLMEPFVGALPLTSVTETELRSAYAALARAGYSTSTIRTAHDRIKLLLKQAVQEARITRNCAENVRPPRGKDPKKTDTWTFEQLQTFSRFVAGERDAAMWGVWITTGLRRGELCGLKWSRVDWASGEIHISWQRTLTMTNEIVEGEVKTRKAIRIVTPPEVVMRSLKAWQLAQPPSEYVFTSKYGRPYWPGSFEKRLKKLARRAGLPEISPHDLRHTFGTRAVEAGTEIKLLSTMMGHSRVETTLNLYVHPDTTAAHAAVDNIASRMLA